MNKVNNLFRELSMMNVKGYNKLTDQQKYLFDKTYKRHIMAMGTEMRKSYSEHHLTEVKADKNGLKVYFDNDEWFRYSKDGTWG